MTRSRLQTLPIYVKDGVYLDGQFDWHLKVETVDMANRSWWYCRKDDLNHLIDGDICHELEPQVNNKDKRFLSKKNGQVVKLNTLLLTYNKPNIPSSIRIDLYVVSVGR
jgi:hypothetical protein